MSVGVCRTWISHEVLIYEVPQEVEELEDCVNVILLFLVMGPLDMVRGGDKDQVTVHDISVFVSECP